MGIFSFVCSAFFCLVAAEGELGGGVDVVFFGLFFIAIFYFTWRRFLFQGAVLASAFCFCFWVFNIASLYRFCVGFFSSLVECVGSGFCGFVSIL